MTLAFDPSRLYSFEPGLGFCKRRTGALQIVITISGQAHVKLSVDHNWYIIFESHFSFSAKLSIDKFADLRLSRFLTEGLFKIFIKKSFSNLTDRP